MITVVPVHPQLCSYKNPILLSLPCLLLQKLLVIPGMFITQFCNSCIVCHVIMWQNQCWEAFVLVCCLPCSQKEEVINILLIVLRRWSASKWAFH